MFPVTVSTANNIRAIEGNGLALFLDPTGDLRLKDANGKTVSFSTYIGGTVALGDLLNVDTTGETENDVLQLNSFGIWESRSNLTINGIQSTQPMFIVITNVNGGVSMVDAGTTTYTINADVLSLSGAINMSGTAASQLSGLHGIQARESTLDPTIADIANSNYIGWYNSTSDQFRIWFNNNGILLSTDPFN